MRAGFIIDNGDGTIHVEIEESWNTPDNKPNQLAKYDLDETHPQIPEGIPRRYWAWNGSEIVEASQDVKDEVDAAIAAREEAQENAGAPDSGWENLSRRDRFILRVVYKLAKQHWPGMTIEQFREQIRAEWDATRESAE